MERKRISVQTADLACCVWGSGKIDLVVEMGLGAVMAEWRPLAEHHTVLVYERAGYGSSSMRGSIRSRSESWCFWILFRQRMLSFVRS